MNLLKKLYARMRSPADLFDKAPALCPWYFKETSPRLTRLGQVLRWRWVEKIGSEYAGAFILADQTGTCFGILKTYTYLLPGPGHDTFLVWPRTNDAAAGRPEIKLSLYATDMLLPIQNHEERILKLRDAKTEFFYFNPEPQKTISIPLNADAEHSNHEFPAEFKPFPEFCAVTDIPGLYGDPNKRWDNSAIVLIKPQDNRIQVYPQDWFNKSDADFGYQWITMAVRNPATGLIHGQGIRIGDFILDETKRQIL